MDRDISLISDMRKGLPVVHRLCLVISLYTPDFCRYEYETAGGLLLRCLGKEEVPPE